MYIELAVLAVFVFLYSAIAGRVERTPISGPMIFTVVGLIIGPIGLGWLQPDLDNEGMRMLADITLALVLFIDAANSDLGVVKRGIRIPQRMLAFGLPLTILLGFGVGLILFDQLSMFEVAILATMLAATDAALGKAVISNKAVPARIREGLNIESGLNDGICVPILLLFIALALGTDTGGSSITFAIKLVAQEVGIGLVVGLGMAAIGARILKVCYTRGWITEIWMQLPIVALALGSFAVAQSLHGSGYVAAFTGGLLFGSYQTSKSHGLILAAEGTSETMALITWVMFGSAVLGQSLGYFSWQVAVYAILSLTVVRMLPMFVSLTGSGESTTSKLFLGWFGPRGLASIVFAIIVLNRGVEGGGLLAITVVCTVALSIIVHGFTANPLARKLGPRMQAGKKLSVK
jgi:NhaP-type Na+/H+ or K+/H+ antiporter